MVNEDPNNFLSINTNFLLFTSPSFSILLLPLVLFCPFLRLLHLHWVSAFIMCHIVWHSAAKVFLFVNSFFKKFNKIQYRYLYIRLLDRYSIEAAAAAAALSAQPLSLTESVKDKVTLEVREEKGSNRNMLVKWNSVELNELNSDGLR